VYAVAIGGRFGGSSTAIAASDAPCARSAKEPTRGDTPAGFD